MFVLFRAVLWSTLFIGLVLLYIPAQFVSGVGLSRSLSTPVEIVGLVLGSAGLLLALWSIATFITRGKGTPAPFDPPRRLVRSGPYRYVRNPMYIGAGAALLGAAVIYHSWALVGYLAAMFVLTHSFVLFYEEPTLRRMFGADYIAYSSEVRRWLPKLRA